MTSMQSWTPEQWATFTATIAVGLAAVFVLAVHRFTRRPTPRRHAARAPWPMPAPATYDPVLLDYSSPGAGSLRDLLTAEPDPALRTSAEVQADEDAWINAYADLSGLMPETAAAAETMRVAVEPALRKARLWLMRAGEEGARAVLAEWRTGTATGEYPAVDHQYMMARALLVS